MGEVKGTIERVISELGDEGADMNVEVYLIKKSYFTNCQILRGNFYNYIIDHIYEPGLGKTHINLAQQTNSICH